MAARVTSRESNRGGILLALPALLWLGLFFLLPLIFVVVISFLTRGSGGSAVLPFTLSQYTRVFDTFWIVLQRTLVTAFVTTVICLLAGYPLAYFITRRQSNFGKQFALFLVILPFWTNFLIRTYAWRVILGREGIINSTLMNAGIISEPLSLLNTEFAVILGLVYGFLPFMVLPIYASLSRFDFRFIEAADATLDYLVTGLLSNKGSVPLSGVATNQESAKATLVVSGETETLTIPVRATYLLDLAPPRKAPSRAAAPAEAAPLQRGAKLYERHCADCHGTRGEGVPGASPPLAGNPTLLQPSAVNLMQVVRRGAFAVATAAHPRPYGMPPIELSDAELADLLSFLRQSWGHRAAPVDALDVLRLR